MLINNRFSNKNKLIYKMKCINTRNNEYEFNDEVEFNKIEKYNERSKKVK